MNLGMLIVYVRGTRASSCHCPIPSENRVANFPEAVLYGHISKTIHYNF